MDMGSSKPITIHNNTITGCRRAWGAITWYNFIGIGCINCFIATYHCWAHPVSWSIWLFCVTGDPEDKTLRKVEIEVVIPKVMREKAKVEKCVKEVQEFEKCCKDSALLMVVKCRNENSILRECLTKWYQNDEFRGLCTEQYLKERSEYRATGTKKPTRRV